MYYYRLRMSHIKNTDIYLTKVLEAKKKDNIDLNLSPNHKKLQEGTYFFMTKQGRAMTNNTNKLTGNINAGNVFQISLSNVNVSKADIKNLTLVIIENI